VVIEDSFPEVKADGA